MNFNYSVTEQIEQFEITVNYNGLTGREIILINGEQKHNRLNWTAMKSEYLLNLDEHTHVRIQLSVTLDSTLNVTFLRGGKVLAQHTLQLYSQPESKVLQEPENVAWLAELTLPKRLSMLLPAAILLLMLSALLKSTLLASTLMGLLTLLCLVLLFKPLMPAAMAKPLLDKRILNIGFAKGMVFGASVGGVVGYSYSVFTSTVVRLLFGS